MSLDKFNEEFIAAIEEIMYSSLRINSSFDRVRTMQWVRKLKSEDSTKLESARIRNEYIQFLRIILSNEPIYFCYPFKDEPPDILAPLAEVLTNNIVDRCPGLSRTGPILPVMCHKTSDGKAFMTVKRCPEGGVFCYLAVAPHVLEE